MRDENYLIKVDKEFYACQDLAYRVLSSELIRYFQLQPGSIIVL